MRLQKNGYIYPVSGICGFMIKINEQSKIEFNEVKDALFSQLSQVRLSMQKSLL